MDRDQRWERVKKAYNLITKGVGTPTQDAWQALKNAMLKISQTSSLQPTC